MAKMTSLDQIVFVPIEDETKGGVTYEMQMTLGEFLGKFLPDFTPVVIEIPDYVRSSEYEDQEADDE